ncbi:M56 family metallopeptidase [Dyadobacter sp. CY261]|uniref:M56 family metallopeptidase n=1 Tax=Dyadobacter sp. CY261 TaxID=2907203 RepID=UPI001F2B2584|nr:M56 family metallopeptidase [Dyadobacter sp. CY261]MCF0070171.1 M56 family metallopeptidase [Dyadobacter sp. CY261]
MSAFPDYLLKLSVSFTLIALFYHLVLRKLTFYNLNRHYLRFYSLLCFLIPLININTVIAPSPTFTPTRAFVQSVPTITRVTAPETSSFLQAAPSEPAFPEVTDWILWIWIAGMALMVLRLLLQIRSYLKIKSQSHLISDDGVKIYHFDLKISPFSFWNSIFYNPHLHQPDELQDMILHEYIHVRQWHSVDVIWSEILCIVNWFNPFAWLIRSAIRQNLEYIADQKVLENHSDTKAYQYLLLKAAVGPEFSIVNQFGYHSLKQRIIMMNKNASPRILMACFLFILPLMAVMLAAFRVDQPDKKKTKSFWIHTGEQSTRQPKDRMHLAGLLLDSETRKPLAGIPLEISHDQEYIKTIRTDKDGYYFIEVPILIKDKETHSYGFGYETDEYLGFGGGKSYQDSHWFGDAFNVYFLRKAGRPAPRFEGYGVSAKPFYDVYHPSNTRAELKTYLLTNSPPFKEEMALRQDFLKNYHWPKEVITLYKGGYFDRKKQLIGYEGKTSLYLNGKEAKYKEINYAFRDYPYMLSQAQERRSSYGGVCNEIAYLTFPLHRDAPPAALLKGNVEIKDVPSFNLSRLKNEPYLLDGFRQVYGASSNLMPLKEEVKRVMLLKGRLARYYDPALDQIWWIETRPVTEVFERPDFASK